MTPSQIPLGYKFLPTDSELLHYLFNKANGLHAFIGNIIHDCDIYGDEKVWMDMFLQTNKEELFFFSKLRKKSDHGRRVDRCSLNGTWKESHSKMIRSGNRIIGSKHFFNFIPRKGFCIKERLLMNEYRIAGDLINRVKDASVVICRISRKKALRSRRGGEEHIPQTEATEPAQQVEALTDGTDMEDFINGLMISPEELRDFQIVLPTLSLQKNDESFGAAALQQPATTETVRQVEALTDDTALVEPQTTETTRQVKTVTHDSALEDFLDANLKPFEELISSDDFLNGNYELQEEAPTDDTVMDDCLDGLLISPEELRDLLSLP